MVLIGFLRNLKILPLCIALSKWWISSLTVTLKN